MVNFQIELKNPVDERITVGRARCDESLTKKILKIADQFKIDDTNSFSELIDDIIELECFFVSTIPADTRISPLSKDHFTIKETRADLEDLLNFLDKSDQYLNYSYKVFQKIFSPQKPNYLAITKLAQNWDDSNIDDFIDDLDITRNWLIKNRQNRNHLAKSLKKFKSKGSRLTLEDWKHESVKLIKEFWKNKIGKESEPKAYFIGNSSDDPGNNFTKFTCIVMDEFAGVSYSQCKTILTIK